MRRAADSVSMTITYRSVAIEVSQPLAEYKNTDSCDCLDRPLASVAAALAAESLGLSITVVSERYGQASA